MDVPDARKLKFLENEFPDWLARGADVFDESGAVETFGLLAPGMESAGCHV